MDADKLSALRFIFGLELETLLFNLVIHFFSHQIGVEGSCEPGTVLGDEDTKTNIIQTRFVIIILFEKEINMKAFWRAPRYYVVPDGQASPISK